MAATNCCFHVPILVQRVPTAPRLPPMAIVIREGKRAKRLYLILAAHVDARTGRAPFVQQRDRAARRKARREAAPIAPALGSWLTKAGSMCSCGPCCGASSAEAKISFASRATRAGSTPSSCCSVRTDSYALRLKRSENEEVLPSLSRP